MSSLPRVIKIDTDGEIKEIRVSSLEYPALNHILFPASNNVTNMVEFVQPAGLAFWNDKQAEPNIQMVVDEEGLLKGLPLNKLASFLYGTHKHGRPIVGNAYLVGMKFVMEEDGPDRKTVGVPDDFTVDTAWKVIAQDIVSLWD